MSALIRALVPQSGGAGGQQQQQSGQQQGVMGALFGKEREQQQVEGPPPEAPPDVDTGGSPQDYLEGTSRTSKSQNPINNLFKPQLKLNND